uniref:Uncharacterized protein n=1 Tax=Pararge aegeria TaxID=116150 RepID=S4NW30_9NEOP
MFSHFLIFVRLLVCELGLSVLPLGSNVTLKSLSTDVIISNPLLETQVLGTLFFLIEFLKGFSSLTLWLNFLSRQYKLLFDGGSVK